MHPSQKYLDPSELAKLSGLQLRTRAIVDGYLAGHHRSTGRGLSLEFTEHREYSPGDDLRHIDWKVYGRTDKHYLKQFEDETNLGCYLLLDASESMAFRGPSSAMSKFEFAKCIAAAIAWIVQSNQDAFGFALLRTNLDSFFPATSSPAAFQEFLERLDEQAASSTVDFSISVRQFLERVSRRSVVILFSDCFGNRSELLDSLRYLSFCRHDVTLVHVLDAAEIDFPYFEATVFESMEDSSEVATDAASIADAYRTKIQQLCSDLRSSCGRHSVRYCLARTDQPIEQLLSQVLATRVRH